MLVLRQWRRKVVQKLEAVVVGLVYRERWSLCLLVEVYETSRSRLNLSLVVSIYSTELRWIYPLIMHCLFALSVASRWFEGMESISSSAVSILLIFFGEKFFVLPHLVQYARTLFRRGIFH